MSATSLSLQRAWNVDSSSIHSGLDLRIYLRVQAINTVNPKKTPLAVGSYGYRNCSKISCPFSSSESKSSFIPRLTRVSTFLSRRTISSCSFLRACRVLRFSWPKSSFKLCLFGNWPHSIKSKHLRYNSVASAAFTLTAKFK